MAAPGIMRLAPTFRAIEIREAMTTAGMPRLSISLAIADPQRVQVPQVQVMIAPLTLASKRALEISRPK